MSFVMLDKENPSSGSLEIGGFQHFLPGSGGRWFWLCSLDTGSSGCFSIRKRAVLSLASKASKSSWTSCQLMSRGAGQWKVLSAAAWSGLH